MPYLTLPEPDWDALEGGADESKWVLDRDRKVGLVVDLIDPLLVLSRALDEQGAAFSSTPEILRADPNAIDWYLALAGFALNTLQYIRERPANFGITRRVLTVRKNLLEGKEVADADLTALTLWINTELAELYPEERQTLENARAVVWAILGGRALGQGQNLGGDDGVLLLKRLLATRFEQRDVPVFVDMGDGFISWRHPEQLTRASRLRFEQRLVADFSGGGRHADIRVTDGGVTIAQGEIKARKDISNIWESWMPQVVDHMRTWAGDNPDAVRLFFGTLITTEMVAGLSSGDVRRAGLKTLYRNGMLSSAYNLSKIASSDRAAEQDFDVLVDQLYQRIS